MKNTTRILLVMLTLLACHVCLASVPTVMNYQGRLTNSAGQPVTDGSYQLVFNLYSVSTGGTAVWTETQSVQLTGGIFSVLLGSVTPLPSSAFLGTTWLETVVSAVFFLRELRSRLWIRYALVVGRDGGGRRRDEQHASGQFGDREQYRVRHDIVRRSVVERGEFDSPERTGGGQCVQR